MLRLLSYCSLLILFLGTLVHSGYAQEETSSQDFARNSIFLELGGNAILYSLNYDRKFSDNFSGRIGGMFLGVSANDPNTLDGRISLLMMPLMANYLVGSGNSRLELGAGPMVVFASGGGTIENEQLDNFSGGGLGFTSTIGYRLQPRNGGFLFRIGLTPIFGPGYFIPWAGLSLGATF